MKLINLSYREPRNELQAYEFNFDNDRISSKVLEPLCFVGLNGSGKSKLLEILASIFFELDRLWRNTGKAKPITKANFCLEYQLLPSRKYKNVIIEGEAGKSLLVKADGNVLEPQELSFVMPSNIIGYSSGSNETISQLFHELREREFRRVLKDVSDGRTGSRELSRTLFLDRDSTKILLLTAFIFSGSDGRDFLPTVNSSKKLVKNFSKFINLEKLQSFRIVIDTDSGRIVLSQRMERVLEKLQRCALMVNSNDENKERIYEMDFFLCEESKNAFINEFKTAQDFYEELYELYSLNLISSSKSKIHRVFDIPENELRVLIKNPIAETNYLNLSDGEHQFIQVFTSLVYFSREDSIFLLDEPESHFNPAWRAKFVLAMDDLLTPKQKSSEFLISTHSPYLVSACKSRNVTIFKKQNGKITCSQPRKETYGGTFDSLLKELFEVISPIAEHSKESIKQILKSKDVEKMKLALSLFAESPYKRDLYEAILRDGHHLDFGESTE
ncbi:AAA family ATPase [Pseudoalteromonas carrageenovora]|uniref:AAA family ATPase n=1 Tax=Pseudoalteromonas carrageenovora TaxID=227 RepID=UPI00311EA7CC